MNTVKLCIIAIAAVIFIAACSQTATTPNTANTNANTAAPSPSASKAVVPATVDDVAMARDLYTTHCMTCHKDSGKGGKTTVDGKTIDPDDITTEKQKAKPDEKIYGYIADGFPDDGMPAFKDKLTADQIKLVVKHVRTLQAK